MAFVRKSSPISQTLSYPLMKPIIRKTSKIQINSLDIYKLHLISIFQLSGCTQLSIRTSIDHMLCQISGIVYNKAEVLDLNFESFSVTQFSRGCDSWGFHL